MFLSPHEAKRSGKAALNAAATILVVDDYPSLSDMAATALRQAGYRVLTALDGETALRLASAQSDEKIDLLIIDYQMPRMRGDDLARQLQATQPAAEVILMSNIVPRPPRPPAYRLLTKPFSSQSLLTMVQAALDHAETR